MIGSMFPQGGGVLRLMIVSVCFAAICLSAAGCYRATRESGAEGHPPAAAGGAETQATATGGTGSPVPPPAREAPSGEIPLAPQVASVPDPQPGEWPQRPSSDSSLPGARETIPEREEAAAVPSPEGIGSDGKPASEEAATGAPEPPSPLPRKERNGKDRPGEEPRKSPRESLPREAAETSAAVIAPLAGDKVFPQNGPPWARSREELVYRVEFLGITMGYARFTFLGKVLLFGREAYHLRVRAWTSDMLSVLYPIDDTIDYFLDPETIVPLRQEYRKSRKEDDVAIFDQEKGKIVYRYLKDGKIRKEVDVVPNVYDPVSVAYYFRSRDIREGEKARPMYAGRKLYEISAKPVGFERIRTDRGEFDTIVVQPVIRRDGREDKKGDLRMWMTRDERHIPVRVYAKFRKIRTWTLVGELLPDQQGG